MLNSYCLALICLYEYTVHICANRKRKLDYITIREAAEKRGITERLIKIGLNKLFGLAENE